MSLRCDNLIVLFFCLLGTVLQAQGYRILNGTSADLYSQRWIYRALDSSGIHGSIRNYSRRDLAHYAARLDSSGPELDKLRLEWMFNENNEFIPPDHPYYARSKKAFLGFLYPSPANMIQLDKKDFSLRINPIIHFEYAPSLSNDQQYFNNLRGLALRGRLDDKLYFYANILETQSRFPDYMRSWISRFQAVPGAGFYKEHQSRIFNVQNGQDYLRASGYLGFRASKHFSIELGHGSQSIGDGIRSLFLSEFAGNYFYLRMDIRVWKFHYQTLTGELSPISARQDEGDQLLPKKYFATHYLSIKPRENLRFGLFETVVFARENTFEFQYLNPIILYRAVEQSLGSPDNVILGIDFNWILWNRVSLYGQLAIDEFVFDQMFSGNNWWGNKWAAQIGATYYDAFGLEGFDLQVEYNVARPYTWAHRDTFANYAHFNQSLAHPLGANFKEGIFRLRYVRGDRWLFEWTNYAMMYGEDRNGENYGMNVLRNNEDRVMDEGVTIGQGIRNEVFRSELLLSYMIFHNAYVDLHAGYRKVLEPDLERSDNSFLGIGFRMNIGFQRLPF